MERGLAGHGSRVGSRLRHLDRYAFPDVTGPEQFVWVEPTIRQAQGAGKYVVGYDPIEMYERMRALMGHHKLTEFFGGGICFWNTVDIQWSTRGLGTWPVDRKGARRNGYDDDYTAHKVS